jgi:hypothetical protein
MALAEGADLKAPLDDLPVAPERGLMMIPDAAVLPRPASGNEIDALGGNSAGNSRFLILINVEHLFRKTLTCHERGTHE